MSDTVTIPLSLLSGGFLAILGAMLKTWSDVQAMRTKVAELEEGCKKVAVHETEIALLKATVTRLETIPDKLDRLYELLRSKA